MNRGDAKDIWEKVVKLCAREDRHVHAYYEDLAPSPDRVFQNRLICFDEKDFEFAQANYPSRVEIYRAQEWLLTRGRGTLNFLTLYRTELARLRSAG